MCSLSECSMEGPQSPESDTTVFAPFSDKLMGALPNVAPVSGSYKKEIPTAIFRVGNIAITYS